MPRIDEIKQQVANKFKDAIINVDQPRATQFFIDIKKEKIKDVCNALVAMGGRYLVSVGYDNIERDKTLGMIHTFAFDKDDVYCAVRAAVPEEKPVMDSITPDIPNAGWSEREFMDHLGMQFSGHPKPKRLILSDDWPEGLYPLRKTVPWNIQPPSAEGVAYQLDACPDGCTVVPVGPYHPTLHEPAHFALFVDGETIKGCDYRGFMVHRGIEKLCQSQLTYNEIPFVAERICGICGSVHATSYAQAVESAGDIKISRRAEYIRTIMLEIERIHSHLLWLGVAGHLIGYNTVFMHSWRVREPIMWLGERMTGNRKTYGMIVVGGVRRDITPEIKQDILNVIKTIEEEMVVIKNAIIGDTSIHKRTKQVGYITKEDTIKWSLVGPVARARGVDIDVRRDHPYAAYDDMQFSVPVVDSCDVWGTVLVRVLETFEAINIVRQALDKLPDDGPILTELAEPIKPFSHAIAGVEAPRGEVVHYIITGEENRPERWRVRAPTYPNLQGVPLMLLNNELADAPIIIGSIDPCFSCTERVEVVDIKNGGVKVFSRSELERIAKKKY
jgi:Ni,Fe-hydrogenase III large subunit/Ni,Fe-hydrogenase III component G